MQTPEWIVWVPMLVLILVLGVYPNLVFEMSDPAVGVVSELVAAVGR